MLAGMLLVATGSVPLDSAAAELTPHVGARVSVRAGAPRSPVDHARQAPSIREAAAERRRILLARLGEGIAIIQSADRSQPNLYEFMVPETENHDFTYYTGLTRAAPPGSVLVLNPNGETYRELLYTSDDVQRVKELTGMTHVYPQSRFLEDLSSALTDYRNLRITQLRFKPVASDLARGLGDTRKVVWFNYPRFTNLNEPANPRLALVAKLREASAEVEVRDAGELIDRQRMIHDAFSLAAIRRAVEITGHGIKEAMRASRPGMTTREVGEITDFVYRYNGARFGFPTGTSAGRTREEAYATAREEMEARERGATIAGGDLIHMDTGAEWEQHSADVQRVWPADATFTPAQRRFYEVVLNVQKTVISKVRPGVTWRELHDLAVQMLRDAGGLDKTYTYGIGHYIGMEVHDHGDYVQPLQPGMVLAIEQGAVLDGVRVAFEDDVLVTATGFEWLSRSIPIEVADVERVRKEAPAIGELGRLKAPRGESR